MSFNISFYRFVGDAARTTQMESLDASSDTAANPDEILEIQRIASVLANAYPGSEWGPYEKGIEYGAGVSGPGIPDIEVWRREVFISYHPDTSDPSSLQFLRELIALLASHDYEAYDPQKGELIFADSYEW